MLLSIGGAGPGACCYLSREAATISFALAAVFFGAALYISYARRRLTAVLLECAVLVAVLLEETAIANAFQH